ncbi:MAG: hypothetical protein ABI367_07435 [Mucilaginibacter sp.]
METPDFTIKINGTAYTVKQYSDLPPLFDVSAKEAYHRIGKTDAGLWVYVESALITENMPLQEIGEAIEQHLETD